MVSSRINREKRDKHGDWKAKGEACEIFANSVICGWISTFEFSEVEAPIGEKTGWIMQEYKITEKEQRDQTKSKESSVLCRVFSCCDENLNNEMKPEHENKVNNEDLDTWALQLSLMASVNHHTSSNDGQCSICESQANNQTEGVGSSLVDKFIDPSDDDIVAELDCILRGDYLEVNDLGDVASHLSSSENSSRMSLASDEYFDSLALLRDLDDEKKEDLNGKGSTSNYNIMMCEIANDVVVENAFLESLIKGSGAAAKEIEQIADNNISSEQSPDQAAKRLEAERTDEGPSHSCRATTSSSSSSSHEPGDIARREEKIMKKLMKILCFKLQLSLKFRIGN